MPKYIIFLLAFRLLKLWIKNEFEINKSKTLLNLALFLDFFKLLTVERDIIISKSKLTDLIR